MRTVNINLNELVNPPYTDAIFGRDFGKKHATDKKLLSLIREDDIEIHIIIDDSIVKAINDSFIKGFFSDVFNELKTKANVEKRFIIDANQNFKNLFYKNWIILESIFNQ